MPDDARRPPLPAERWIIANLDCERDFGGRRVELRRDVSRRLERLAPLLRILGEDARVIPPSAWNSGSLEGPPAALLAWGETTGVRDLRLRFESAGEPLGQSNENEPLYDRLWRLPVPMPSAAALANHRSFLLRTARKLGVALPGSCLIDDGLINVDEQLDAALRADRLPQRALGWLLKTPYSAAGSGHRVLVRDRLPPDDKTRARIGSLVRRHGCLLLEPLMERLADFGCCAVLEGNGVRIVSVHEQSIERSGWFRGIRLAESTQSCPGLEGEEREALLAAARDVGASLAEIGYRGAFGIDAWRYVGDDGRPRFQPLGEVNARLTFGFVARCAYERAVEAGRIATGSDTFYDLRAAGDFEADPLAPFSA